MARRRRQHARARAPPQRGFLSRPAVRHGTRPSNPWNPRNPWLFLLLKRW